MAGIPRCRLPALGTPFSQTCRTAPHRRACQTGLSRANTSSYRTDG